MYLAVAEVYMASKDYPSSMTHLLKCKTICDSYHMENFSIIASQHIAEVQVSEILNKSSIESHERLTAAMTALKLRVNLAVKKGISETL